MVCPSLGLSLHLFVIRYFFRKVKPGILLCRPKNITLNNSAVRQPRSAQSLTPWRESTITLACKASSFGQSVGGLVNQEVDHFSVCFSRSISSRWWKKTQDWGPTRSLKAARFGRKRGKSVFPGSIGVAGFSFKSAAATADFSSSLTRLERSVRKMRHSPNHHDCRSMTTRQVSAISASILILRSNWIWLNDLKFSTRPTIKRRNIFNEIWLSTWLTLDSGGLLKRRRSWKAALEAKWAVNHGTGYKCRKKCSIRFNACTCSGDKPNSSHRRSILKP